MAGSRAPADDLGSMLPDMHLLSNLSQHKLPDLLSLLTATGTEAPQTIVQSQWVWLQYLLHTLLILAVAVYSVKALPLHFNGTRHWSPVGLPGGPLSGDRSGIDSTRYLSADDEVNSGSSLSRYTFPVFSIFLAAELGILSSQGALSNSRSYMPAYLNTISNQLPRLWSGRLQAAMRMYAFVRSLQRDALLLVFAVGLWGWTRS